MEIFCLLGLVCKVNLRFLLFGGFVCKFWGTLGVFQELWELFGTFRVLGPREGHPNHDISIFQ